MAGATELEPVTTAASFPGSTAGANPKALESLSVQKHEDKSPAHTEKLNG